MLSVMSLWLPILVSAVFVFIASSIIHMLLGYHASDYRRLPDEDRVAGALRGTPPGDYVLPWAGSMKAMSDPAFVAKQNEGPVGLLSIGEPGPRNMGAQLAGWFIYSVVISILAGYVASRAAGAGGDFFDVFRYTGTVAFAAYGVGLWRESIWFNRPWSSTLKASFDGLIYALITAGTFGWLWPS